MKFAEHLSAHITPEWRKQYIRYEELKEILYDAVEQAPPAEDEIDAENAERKRYFANFEESFFTMCEKELTKINVFFAEKLAESQRKFAALKNELAALEEGKKENMNNGKVDMKVRFRRRISRSGSNSSRSGKHKTPGVGSNTPINKRTIHDLKLAVSEFYLSLVLLQNYQQLNHTGFRKILKKHDKNVGTSRGLRWHADNVDTASFITNKEINKLIEETENMFTSKLEAGNRGKAMKRLRVPPLSERLSSWTTYRVGVYSGICLVLFITIILVGFVMRHDKILTSTWRQALRMYRGMFMMVEVCFLVAVNTYGWRRSGVNHVLIFELDPRSHLSHQELLEIAGLFGSAWSLSVLAYMFSSLTGIPWLCQPLSLGVFFLIYLFNPTKTCHYKARTWFLRIMARIITAPLTHVNFADFWLADQLNSLVIVLLDFQYLICYYSIEAEWLSNPAPDICHSNIYGIRPLVAILPAWFRFAQCLRRYFDTHHKFPHLVNAGKYSTTFFVVLFSTLTSIYRDKHGSGVESAWFWFWIVFGMFSSIYTFTWDIKMDWGLFEKNAPADSRFLREETVYAYKTYYYAAIVEDFVLRFAWTLSLSIGEMTEIPHEILLTILGPLELFRRFIWNFFRLENEHLNNCGEFRAVRDISIMPLTSNDQAMLEKMMDEEDGEKHRVHMNKQKHDILSVYVSLDHQEGTDSMIDV